MTTTDFEPNLKFLPTLRAAVEAVPGALPADSTGLRWTIADVPDLDVAVWGSAVGDHVVRVECIAAVGSTEIRMRFPLDDEATQNIIATIQSTLRSAGRMP